MKVKQKADYRPEQFVKQNRKSRRKNIIFNNTNIMVPNEVVHNIAALRDINTVGIAYLYGHFVTAVSRKSRLF